MAAEPQPPGPTACWWMMPAALEGQMCNELQVAGGAMGLWEAPWSPASIEINALGDWDHLKTLLGAFTNVPPGA